ncbi:hypothetical protein DPMN_170932 [Dreissena polymorpha]|uniref:Secreted protein n=1 Tax=Dreissena polymorpha TaxID=45954 RepID=A0A9D4DY91_DREPO|nr:hypothetical protein DPMN_170932 [Dreissena polymorpha]
MERFVMVCSLIVCLNGIIGFTNSVPINDALVNNGISSNLVDLKYLVESPRTLNRMKRQLPPCPNQFPNCCIFCDTTGKQEHDGNTAEEA